MNEHERTEARIVARQLVTSAAAGPSKLAGGSAIVYKGTSDAKLDHGDFAK
jgi:hypothetical protein